jgi:hypothetical protein
MAKQVSAQEFSADLGRLSADLEALAPAPVGAFVRDQARGAAPYVSGALRASLFADEEAGQVVVGSGLIYAGVIHNGWAEHGISADPYLVPVAENTAPLWGRIYLAEVTRTVASNI